MLLLVRPMRFRGRRLPWREVLNGPVYEGDLITYEIQSGPARHRAAKLLGKDPAAAQTLSPLYEPVLVGIATLAFRLRGFERHESPEGPYSVIQEWHCEAPEPTRSRQDGDW